MEDQRQIRRGLSRPAQLSLVALTVVTIVVARPNGPLEFLQGFEAVFAIAAAVWWIGLWFFAISETIHSNLHNEGKVAWVFSLVLFSWIAVLIWLFVGPRPIKDDPTEQYPNGSGLPRKIIEDTNAEDTRGA